MTIEEYVIDVVNNSAKYRVMNKEKEVAEILNHLEKNLHQVKTNEITSDLKDYIFAVFEEDYIHYYESVR